jgi:small subunit ribosomal protein S4
MARVIGPVCKLCRREGEKLFLKGSRCLSPKCAIEKRAYAPGQHGQSGQFRRNRSSDYSLQLREKQKARRIYGVLEKQFRRYFVLAQRSKSLTGAMLLSLLESRLDNVVYRMGLAESRPQARQLVQHGHLDINGVRADSPARLVKSGDVVSVRAASRSLPYFKTLVKEMEGQPAAPQWLSVDLAGLSCRVLHLPSREEIDLSLNEQLIVEYYSRRL